MIIGGASSHLLQYEKRRPETNKRLQSPASRGARTTRKWTEDAAVYKTQVVRSGSGNDRPSSTLVGGIAVSAPDQC
jgi:hypothetical protein